MAGSKQSEDLYWSVAWGLWTPDLIDISVSRLTEEVLVFKVPLLYLIIVPKWKSRDAGNLDTPKRSCKLLPLNEKVCMYRKKS